MLEPKTRWVLKEINEGLGEQFANELQLSPLLTRLLLIRGIDSIEKATAFLYGEEKDFYDPFLLSDMDKAIQRTREAIEYGEPILIYGDYDADGVTSTSILVHTLRKAGAVFQYYIPNRFTEGYGLNGEALRKAAEKGFAVVITVDTGISAVKEAELAKELGLDLIITDHHEPPQEIPDAFAVINPKKPGCTYPFPMLAGAGVAFKFAHALFGSFPHFVLDIAGVGTIADLVPLV
ncbi:MAG TPA: single-stranded-DNA-specific exonuclease RecJ, partial [Paenibacillaceae bacterium]|nr:single-stranded-DNA-specific exonuclease RecJ [Paenibacillaceae bacterium]